jgi:two-component system response regulator HupR/HoxA
MIRILHLILISERITDQVDGPAPVGNLRGINTKGGLKAALEELEAYMIKEGLKRCNLINQN